MDILKLISSDYMNIVNSAFYILFAIIVWLILKKFIIKITSEKRAVSHIIYNAVKYVICLLTVLFVLQENGINVGKVVAGVGILSAVIGLALQDEFKDFIMGFHILLDDFFKIGDVVKYGDFEGEVVSISLKTTKLKDCVNGSILTISNRNISEIERVTGQVDIIVPLTYEADVKLVRATLEKAAERVKKLENVEDALYVGMVSYESSAINYKFRYFAPVLKKNDMYCDVMEIIHEEIMNAGIEIPYDKLDVYIADNNK